jgi:hypothetical protein
MPKPDLRVPKKAYSSPILTTYGTVQELTQKVGLRKSNDGGKYPMIKTQM